ncbi:hypothetical protein DD083_01705 [Clostridioides difficile]|nr:hypothetical protein [Clostridioides difficile]
MQKEVAMNKLIKDCVNFFNDCGFSYSICGGYALELFANMHIRPHSDIDIWISDTDKEKIIQYMLNQGWDIYEPLGNYLLRPIIDLNKQHIEQICVFAIKPDCSFIELKKVEDDNYKMNIQCDEQLQFDFIELIYNPQKDGKFLFSQNQRIIRDMDKARLITSDNIPYMAPEVVLFCKSIYIDRLGYQKDFDVTVPLLSQEQRDWLVNALITAYPDGHAWIDQLANQY